MQLGTNLKFNEGKKLHNREEFFLVLNTNTQQKKPDLGYFMFVAYKFKRIKLWLT